MAKSKEDKKMNRIAKRFNKELKQDVFNGRFYCRQIKKQRGCDGVMYYLYEVCDAENPSANKICISMFFLFIATISSICKDK